MQVTEFNSKELLSNTISYLRFPLIVGVVFIHNNLGTVNIQGTIIEFDQWPIVLYIMNFFSYTLAGICVPLFFFISGFLFFYNVEFDITVYKRKLKNRLHSLIVPYLIWNFVGFLILLVELHPIFSSYFPLLKDYRVDIISFLSYFWVSDLPISMSGPANPINTPLWFLRDLIVLISFSPFIYWIIRRLRIVSILVLGVIWFLGLGEIVGFPGLCHQSIFFFPLGAYYSIRRINFVEQAYKMKWIPYVYLFLAISDCATVGELHNVYIHKFGILVGMIAVVNLVSIMIKRGTIHTNRYISDASFFIYALHNLFMGKVSKLLFMIIPSQSPVIVLLNYFLIPFVTILICFYLYKNLNRYLPSFAKVVTGGR